MNHWTHQDVLDGLCTFDQVGLAAPASNDPAPDPASVLDLDEVPARVLRKDIMKVYRELGGAAYLKKLAVADPGQFNKYLLKVLPQTVEADVTNHIGSIDSMTLDQIRELPTDALKVHLLRMAKKGNTIDVTPEPLPERTEDSE